ncbi:MAG: SEC-C metal-binding domain-containing protein [bacterium]
MHPAIICHMHINPNGRKRNDPCPCGSGKKFKKCCIDINNPPTLSTFPPPPVKLMVPKR